ncbi:uncharacterized protein LOC113312135 [Papaver somniferum]|uniref:uncharacterized protein LOC113312135 n=1 Tax=Papaver somniferum TaxID=3469 RepID=UPI000E703401|nr:uncharacterized protein LOC113312135 [Papaver somniferum]
MSKISKSLINNKHLKTTIDSLFRSSSSSVKQLSKTLTSKQSLFSNSFSSTTRVINSTHGGGAPNLCSIPASSSVVNGGTTHNIKKMDLRTWIPVRAFCLSHRIDLMGLMSENQANLIPHTPGIGNYIVLRFDNLTGTPTAPPQELDVELSGRSHSSYMVVFKYGSTLMFNMLDHQIDGYLKIIKRHASGTTKDCGDSSQNYIDYKVSEKLKLPPCVQDVSNHMMLQNFNIDGICTIASVLGQSVVLDYYSRLVDELTSAYTNVNTGLKESGTTYNFENVLNKDLVNANLLKLLRRTRAGADIVRWFGLYERSDVAWEEDSEYTHLLDHLRDELKLTQRFANLDRKFKMAELNIWFVGEEANVPRLSVLLFACISCFMLIFFTPIVILPISALDTFLMSL